MEGRTEGVHGNKKKWAQRTWRLDAAMDAMIAPTIKGVARAILRLSLDSAWWRRAKVRLRHAALQRQLMCLSASVHAVQPLPR